ncbi:hypothetical protein TVAG_239850 [Trichomonas vaginalis G3]|uniref:Uncharacterized protein n=1 Tax=Trichomonas vaginalis (strain ATCC PRA-98 / G3) TaxID=412133 RepID=A2EFC8_TRIV3|nr:hypothetical protein TVAGG3_0430820 [Trichomonas vaginalis G3]EAY08625.1 hypothetical protein TVAG_239850 [Trichomonas vaginalis G3]KAI5536739.1 hypothetical protein TVAGG3_0430820 [Trichomonas vaginalis G3]|eukprot:XP_001320848.1 hypothetical protein [Trichomonas vaginalis G3]
MSHEGRNNQKADLPLNANSAVEMMQKMHGELIKLKPNMYKCIQNATDYKKPGMKKGLNTLGDVDEEIYNYASCFRDCLSQIEAFMHDVMLTKMEQGTDYENYERFCQGIDSTRAKLVGMIAEIYEFQKEQDIQRGQEEYIVKSLLNKHRELQKENIDYIIKQMDTVRRFYIQLCMPISSQKCRIQ